MCVLGEMKNHTSVHESIYLTSTNIPILPHDFQFGTQWQKYDPQLEMYYKPILLRYEGIS